MGLSHWPVTLNQLKWEVKWNPLFTVNGPSVVWGCQSMRLVATLLHYVPVLAIFLHQIYQRNLLQFCTSGCMEFKFQVNNIYHKLWYKMCVCNKIDVDNISIQHVVLDRHLINIDPRVFAIWMHIWLLQNQSCTSQWMMPWEIKYKAL